MTVKIIALLVGGRSELEKVGAKNVINQVC